MSTSVTSEQRPITLRRMPSILAVGVLFLALGIVDVWRGVALTLGGDSRQTAESMQMLSVGIAALVGGGFVLRGKNWARRLLAAWMLLHVVISVQHPGQLITHLAIFGLLTFLLFRPCARAYFTPSRGSDDAERL